jgi:hypothetical protein
MRKYTFIAAALVCLCLATNGLASPAQPLALKQTAKLTASDGSPNDLFGLSVAISSSTIVVGAPSARGGLGAAYVFVKGSNGWTNATQTAELTPSDGSVNGFFGFSVAIFGSTIVVGAPYGNNYNGGVYVFVEPSTGWSNMTETAKLDDGAQDELGWSVGISGNTIATGSEYKNAAYVFTEPAGGWKATSVITAKLTSSDTANNDYFGFSLSLQESKIVIGSPYATFNGGPGVGAAYVYKEPSSGWVTTQTYDAKLTPSDGRPDDYFGASVSIAANTVLVGADLQTVKSNKQEGAAYIFVNPVGQVSQTAKLTASGLPASSLFGYAVAISPQGDKALITTWGGELALGTAYDYLKPASGWATTSSYHATFTDSPHTETFGSAVALTEKYAAVGNPYVNGNNLSGAVYVFTLK